MNLKLEKNDISLDVNIFKNQNNEISILIETDENNYYFSYSAKINQKNIKSINGESINILKYLLNENNIIKAINDSEIIIEFNLNQFYKIENSSKEFNFIKIIEIIDKISNNIIYIINITIKKNEYYVFWRDPQFAGTGAFNRTLMQCKKFCLEEVNMSFYNEISIEKALKFIKKKINDKIILISNIGEDLSGKRFVEIAREIYGYNLFVLFYSASKYHFIEEFPNCLYTTKQDIYQKYITNFNKEGLKQLKKEVETKYKIKLNGFPEETSLEAYFFKDIFSFSSSFNTGNFIRHVNIKSGNNFLCMTKDGKLITTNKNNKDCEWDITIFENIIYENNNTIINKTITFYSNNYYLGDDYRTLEGHKYMKLWDFKKKDKYYYFISRIDKKKIISIKGPKLKSIKKVPKEDELFELIDIQENDENIINNIYNHSISDNVYDFVDSISMEK